MTAPASVFRPGNVNALEESGNVSQQHGGTKRARQEGVEQEEQERLVVQEAH